MSVQNIFCFCQIHTGALTSIFKWQPVGHIQLADEQAGCGPACSFKPQLYLKQKKNHNRTYCCQRGDPQLMSSFK